MNEFSAFVKPKNTKHSEFIGLCLISSSYMHSYHFETKSYAHHKVYEDFYKDMPDLIDTFVEIYLGSGGTYTRNFPTRISSDQEILDTIISLGEDIYDSTCSAGQSALDEIMTLCKKTKYLLSLS